MAHGLSDRLVKGRVADWLTGRVGWVAEGLRCRVAEWLSGWVVE